MKIPEYEASVNTQRKQTGIFIKKANWLTLFT